MKTVMQSLLRRIFLLLNILLHLELALCINNSTKVSERNATINQKEYVEIHDAYSTRSDNRSVLNPINGTDYWSTGKLNPQGYSDWIAVLNEAKIINFFEFEFDFPPSRLVVYGGLSHDHWLPLTSFDYSARINEIIAKNSKQVLIIAEDYSQIQTDIAFKMIKFEFYNTIDSLITVLLSKVKIGFYRDRREYLIHKLLIENESQTHLCLRRNEIENKLSNSNSTGRLSATISNIKLSLVECHYCMIYYINDCLFTYLKTDSNGHLFSYKTPMKIRKEFYIRNLQISTDNIENQSITEEADTPIEIMKSFLSNKLDYDIDLKSITSNSTLNEETYSIKRVLLDNLTYWSSSLMKKPNCTPINITMVFNREIIIKKLSIFWVNPPFEIMLNFCEKNSNSIVDCTSKSLNVSNLISNFEDVFLKTAKLFILISFDQKRLKDFSYNCIASIKDIFIYKNEIEVGTDKINEDEAMLYSENFYFTNFDFEQANLLKKLNLQNVFQSSTEDNKNHNKKIIKKHYNANFISKLDFQLELKILNQKLKEIYRKIYIHKKLHERYKNFIKNVIKNKPLDLQFDQAEVKNLRKNTAQKSFSELKSIIDPILMIDSSIFEMKKYLLYSEIQIKALREDFIIFIAKKSSKFMNILTDTELKKKIESLSTLIILKEKLKKFEEIKILNENLFYVKSFYLEIMRSDIKSMNETLNTIEEYIEKKKKKYHQDEKEMSETMAFYLQNEKLVNLHMENYFLNFYFENYITKCLKIKLIKNSYFDNFFAKMLIVLSSQAEENFSNIVIIKFFNENFFYFLKIDKISLQIWKRKYETNEKLFEVSNFLNGFRSPQNQNMNEKLFYVYLLIKVNDGQLSIILNYEINNKEDFTNFKDSLIFLTENQNLEYSQMESLYLQNENDFKEKFEGKEIFSIFDIDIKQRGYLGYMGIDDKYEINKNIENENIFFFMVKKLDHVEKIIDAKNKFLRSENFLNYDKTDFNFNFFTDFEKMFKIEIPKIFLEKLKLNNNLSKFYDTKFSVLNNFHLKFEIHFGNFLDDSSLEESNEISNSVYLAIQSERNNFFIIFEIVKMQKRFQLKIFRLSERRGKENIYRVDIEIKNQMTVFILEKKNDYIILRVKSKKSWKEEVFKNIFKFPNLNFLKIGFILNNINDSALRNIYVSDMSNNTNQNKEKGKN